MTDKIQVKDPLTGKVYTKINELEFVDGSIYANVWYSDTLLKIDPKSGQVQKEWDISSLELTELTFQEAKIGYYEGDTLNGIAYDKSSNSFFLSGKYYYLMFKLTLF